MTIAHHPPDDLLLGYAAGAMGEAMALVLATHLALCPQCRRTVAQAEGVGGLLLEEAEETALAPGAMRNVLSRLDEPARQEPVIERSHSAVPEPLRSYIGDSFDSVKWTRVAPGISYKPLLRRGRTRAYLVRSEPGSDAGLHAHYGEEITLCLAGGFTDETGRYARGDVQWATPETLHNPLADAGEVCITLNMRNARLKFRNPVVGFIGYWFGF